MKTLSLLFASMIAAPAVAVTDLPEGAVALSTVSRGRIVSVERDRSSTRVQLELVVTGCANDLGPITYTARRAGRRATLVVTAIDIVNEASARIRCAPSGLLRRADIEIAGLYTMQRLRLELLADSRLP